MCCLKGQHCSIWADRKGRVLCCHEEPCSPDHRSAHQKSASCLSSHRVANRLSSRVECLAAILHLLCQLLSISTLEAGINRLVAVASSSRAECFAARGIWLSKSQVSCTLNLAGSQVVRTIRLQLMLHDTAYITHDTGFMIPNLAVLYVAKRYKHTA